MGLSLSYWTSHPVTDEVRRRLENEARDLAASREWWAEPIALRSGSGRPGITGGTRLLLLGYDTEDGEFVEVDPIDDAFMAARDAKFITEQLSAWSKTHGLTWELQCEGPVGTITEGAPDRTLQAFIDALFEAGASSRDLVEDEERAAEIAEQFATRWG